LKCGIHHSLLLAGAKEISEERPPKLTSKTANARAATVCIIVAVIHAAATQETTMEVAPKIAVHLHH